MKHIDITVEEFLNSQIPFEVESLTIPIPEDLSVSETETFLQLLRQSHIQKLTMGNVALYRLTSDWWFEDLGQKQGLKGARAVYFGSKRTSLDQLTSDQWLSLGQGLKSAGMQRLQLRFTDPLRLTSELWLALGQGLRGAGIKQLDLSNNNLSQLTAGQWLALGQTLKAAEIRQLNLEGNNLQILKKEGSFDALSQVFALPNLRKLNLKGNDFGSLSLERHSRWIDTISACKNLESLSIDSIPVQYLIDLIHRLDFLYEVDCGHPEMLEVLQKKAQRFLDNLIQGKLPTDWNDEKILRIGMLIEKHVSPLYEKEAAWGKSFLASLEGFDFEESAAKNKVIVNVLESLQTAALRGILSEGTIHLSLNVMPESIRAVLNTTRILEQLKGKDTPVQKALDLLLIGCKENSEETLRLLEMIRFIQAQDPKENNYWELFQASLVHNQAHTWSTEVKDLLASYVIGLNPDVSRALQAPPALVTEALPSQDKEERVPLLSDYARFALSLCSEDSPLYTQLGTQLLGLKLSKGGVLEPSQKAALAQKVVALRAEVGLTRQIYPAGPGAAHAFFKEASSDHPPASNDSSKEGVPGRKAPGQH